MEQDPNLAGENLNNIQGDDAALDPKRKIFRWSALAWPIIAVILAIFYLTDLSLYVFWHPVLTSFIKIVYFPFFIFSENVNEDLYFWQGTMISFPNLITIGIAILVSLGLLYVFSRLVIYLVDKYIAKRVILISNVCIFIILLSVSFVLTNHQINKCVAEKEKNQNWTDREAMIGLSLKSDLRNPKKQLIMLYFLNNIKYLYSDNEIAESGSWGSSILIKTLPGKEVETACTLEFNPRVSSAWPTSIFNYMNFSDWEKTRDAICEAEGFESSSIKNCLEFILKDSKKMEGLSYEISENGKVEISERKTVDNQGVYSDKFISFKIDNDKYKVEDPTETGLTFEDIKLGKYAKFYVITKHSDFEKINGLNFTEPFMFMYVPNSSDPSFDVMYNGMDLQNQVIDEKNEILGNYNYLIKNFKESGLEKVAYYTQVNGRKIRISLGQPQYFAKYSELQKEFEEIISSISFNY
ncbi:MAG: hypothetical protein WC848_04850 [Parcubacteria group bacterium]|jgi:hypothetical protein